MTEREERITSGLAAVRASSSERLQAVNIKPPAALSYVLLG